MHPKKKLHFAQRKQQKAALNGSLSAFQAKTFLLIKMQSLLAFTEKSFFFFAFHFTISGWKEEKVFPFLFEMP